MKTIFSILAICFVSLSMGQVNERFKSKPDTSEVQKKSPQELVEEADSSEDTPSAEQKAEDNIWSKIVYGGNLGLSFGSYTFVSVSPAVGYKVNKNLVVGTGFIYRYFEWNQAVNSRGQLVNVEGYSNEIYGPKFFTQFFFADRFFVGSQFEYLNHDIMLYRNQGPPEPENTWTPVLFLEGGLRQNLGRKGFAVVGLRINVLHDFDSPYATNWMPVVGFYF